MDAPSELARRPSTRLWCAISSSGPKYLCTNNTPNTGRECIASWDGWQRYIYWVDQSVAQQDGGEPTIAGPSPGCYDITIGVCTFRLEPPAHAPANAPLPAGWVAVHMTMPPVVAFFTPQNGSPIGPYATEGPFSTDIPFYFAGVCSSALSNRPSLLPAPAVSAAACPLKVAVTTLEPLRSGLATLRQLQVGQRIFGRPENLDGFSVGLKVYDVSTCDPARGDCAPGYGNDVGTDQVLRPGIDPRLQFQLTLLYEGHDFADQVFDLPYDAIGWTESMDHLSLVIDDFK